MLRPVFYRKPLLLLLIVALALVLNALRGRAAPAAPPFDDLTPNQLSFTGRRGVAYTASWDPSTMEIDFSTPDGTFPWDWAGFVGPQGMVALNGYPDVGETFAMSDPSALAGAQPGDLIRVKGRGVLGLAHLTKIGLVVGSGSDAQRSWLSAGEIMTYTLAPHFAGYQVRVLDRDVTVRISSLNPAGYYAVGMIEITISDPTNARLILASDLEPAQDYSSAVEFHNRNDTQLSWDPNAQAVIGTQAGRYPVYVYAGGPLESWSANNLDYAGYLATDTLDGQVVVGTSDGRVALSVAAQPVQYFYIGSQVLAEPDRSDPGNLLGELQQARLSLLSELPVIDSLSMPKIKFVNLLSNLIYAYLVNPNGGLYYTDKAFLYAPDALMPLVVTPHLLPSEMIANYRQALDLLAGLQYTASDHYEYGYRIDLHAAGLDPWPPLPSWYAGNFPDIIQMKPNGGVFHRENYSDACGTALFVNSLASYYRVTGDLAYLQSRQTYLENAVTGMQAFDSNYDAQYGQDGNLFPNLLVPMGDLGLIAGEYPGETAQVVYAYQDAASLYRALGLDTQADDLVMGTVVPMQAAFDGYFWDPDQNFYAARVDQNSVVSETAFYQDRWVHTAFVPLRGSLGQSRLPAILAGLTGPDFFEPGNDVHWLAKGDQSFATPGRWGLSPFFTNGWGMEGGYLVLPNVIPALGYYHLGQAAQAETYANIYFDKWVQYGPQETMMEYDGQTPGRFGESSLYIEAASGTTWLVQTGLGIEINGAQVTIAPRLSGPFTVRNLNITVQGLRLGLDYARDGEGREWINVWRNDGLEVLAPQAEGEPAPTASQTPTKTASPTSTPTATQLPPGAATETPTSTLEDGPIGTAGPSPTSTPTPTGTKSPFNPSFRRLYLPLMVR